MIDFGSLAQRVAFQVGGIDIVAWQVLVILFLLFLLVVMMASVRRHFLEWTVKGAGFGVFLGFILALVVEGIFLVGGTSILTETFKWKDPPKPIARLLDTSREKFTQVLGIETTEPCE